MQSNKLIPAIFLVFILGIVLFYIVFTSKVFVISFVSPHGSIGEVVSAVNFLKKTVEADSNETLKINIVIHEDARTENIKRAQITLNEIASGNIQMGQFYTPFLFKFNSDFLVFEVPYLFRDLEHCHRVVEGKIGQEMLKKLEDNSAYVGLALSCADGFRILNTTKKRLRKASDLKNLVIAANPTPTGFILNQLNVVTVDRLQKKETLDQIRAGKIAGLVSVYPRFILTEDRKLAPIVNELFFNVQASVLLINKKQFYNLSSENQNLIRSAAKQLVAKQYADYQRLVSDLKNNPAKYNAQIVSFSKEEHQKLKKILNKIDWTQKFQLSPNLIHDIKASN